MVRQEVSSRFFRFINRCTVFSHEGRLKGGFSVPGNQLPPSYILFYLLANVCRLVIEVEVALPLQGDSGPDNRSDSDIWKAGVEICWNNPSNLRQCQAE